MIDERMEELASLHVLGALSETEAREFQRAMAADPELGEYVARLSTVTAAMSGAVPKVEPPPRLRAKILEQAGQPQKIIALPDPKVGFGPMLLWALAACLTIAFVFLAAQDFRLHKTVGDQAERIAQLDQLAQTLQSATNDLRRTVLALQETNKLANLRIAMLNCLAPGAPKTLAVTLWDNQRQDGVFVAQNLKAIPADRDYELWVIDENQTPVAAGVFQVDENGKIRMEFKPTRLVKTAGMFAVTEEAKGGVASPTMKNMVLAGN